MKSLLFLSTFATCPKMVFAEAPPAPPADPVAEIVTPVKAVSPEIILERWGQMTLIRPVFRMVLKGLVF